MSILEGIHHDNQDINTGPGCTIIRDNFYTQRIFRAIRQNNVQFLLDQKSPRIKRETINDPWIVEA